MRAEMPIVKSREELDKAPVISIENYLWLEGYAPEVTARGVYVEKQGFLIEMKCLEKSPKAVYTEQDSPVCRDSCMEFFVNFSPETDDRYINFEANANGALHCKIGPGRGNRIPLASLDIPQPELSAFVEEDSWRTVLFVPLGCIQTLYGRGEYHSGDRFRANFYKCGDETETPHYGAWSYIDLPSPDFHRPEFFGEIELT